MLLDSGSDSAKNVFKNVIYHISIHKHDVTTLHGSALINEAMKITKKVIYSQNTTFVKWYNYDQIHEVLTASNILHNLFTSTQTLEDQYYILDFDYLMIHRDDI